MYFYTFSSELQTFAMNFSSFGKFFTLRLSSISSTSNSNLEDAFVMKSFNSKYSDSEIMKDFIISHLLLILHKKFPFLVKKSEDFKHLL